MKCVEINSVCGSGSTGRIVVNISEILRAEGDEAVVVYGRGATDYKYAFNMSSNFDNRMHGLLTRLFDAHGLGSRRATYRLIHFLDSYKPDVIHLHLLHGYYLNYELLFRYLKDKKISVIWTMHDCWALTGHCPHFDRIHCEKWKNECGNCVLKKEYPSSYLLDRSSSNLRRKQNAFGCLQSDQMIIVSPSQWLAGLIKASYLNRYRIEVINNGIDLSIFQPCEGDFRKKYNLENKKIILIVANEMDDRKGLEDVVNLADLLADEYKIVIVGGISSSRKIPSSILVIENITNAEELAKIYSTADVFLNLTLEDNFPTVNLEALGCGLPVVTYNTGGSPESITDMCGRVVRKHDLTAVMVAISEAEKLSKDACVQQAQKFDKRECFEQYVKLMKRMEKEKNEDSSHL